jgi:hypothetical protein
MIKQDLIDSEYFVDTSKDECDQNSVFLKCRNGEEYFFHGLCPKINHDCCGAAKIGEYDWHIFSQDDEHYRTELILDDYQFEKVGHALFLLNQEVINTNLKKPWVHRYVFRDKIPAIKGDCFGLKYTFSGKHIQSIKLTVENESMEFMPFLLKEYVKCFQLKERKNWHHY